MLNAKIKIAFVKINLCEWFFLGSDPPGKTGTVVGWGRTSEGGVIPSHVMEVQVPILSLAACRKMQYRPTRISSYMLCAGDANKDSCQVLNQNKYCKFQFTLSSPLLLIFNFLADHAVHAIMVVWVLKWAQKY